MVAWLASHLQWDLHASLFIHTSHPCAWLFLPHIQAAVPLTRIICGCFYTRCSERTLLLKFSLVLCCVLLSPLLPVFALERHAEEYSPVSAEVRIFIILTLRHFHILKNYQPLDSCPDVRSFQLCRGNQAHRRENRGERMASTSAEEDGKMFSLEKSFLSLICWSEYCQNHFSGADGVKSVISSGDPIQSLYLKNLSNLNANGASEWNTEMERDRREQETECQNCLPLDDLYSLNYKTRPAAKVNSCRQDNEHVNFHLCSGVYAYHSLSFLDSLPSFSLI